MEKQRRYRVRRVRRGTNHSHRVVDVSVHPLVDAVRTFQPRQTKLPVDPVDTDNCLNDRGHGDRGSGRPSRVVVVLDDVSMDRVHVVRSRKFFREKSDTAVRRDRGSYRVPVLGPLYWIAAGRNRRVRFENTLPATGRTVGRVGDQRVRRFGGDVLRQSFRHDGNVRVGIPRAVRFQSQVHRSDVPSARHSGISYGLDRDGRHKNVYSDDERGRVDDGPIVFPVPGRYVNIIFAIRNYQNFYLPDFPQPCDWT